MITPRCHRSTRLAVLLAFFVLCGSPFGPAGALGQVLEQVEKDVRRQVGAPPASAENPARANADPARGAGGDPAPAEVPAVQPGYLGLVANDRNEQGRGLRVLEVMKGGPAEKAGILAGDLIIAINGAAMRTLDDMAQSLEPLSAGRKAEFQIQRLGVGKQMSIVLGRRPTKNDARFPRYGRQPEELPPPEGVAVGDAAVNGAGLGDAATGGATVGGAVAGGAVASPFEARLSPLAAPIPAFGPAPGGPLLGVRTAPLDGERRGLFKISAGAFGALVTSVTPGSAADKIGLQSGMLITSFDSQLIDGPRTLAGLVRAAGSGREVEIGFQDQNGQSHRQTTTLGGAAPADPSAANLPQLAQDPNGDMPPEIGLPAEIPPGAGVDLDRGASAMQARIDGLEQRVSAMEAHIQKLEAALQAAQNR